MGDTIARGMATKLTNRVYDDDFAYYGGTVRIERLGTAFNVNFSNDDTRFFYKSRAGNKEISLITLQYKLNHNDSLVLNLVTRTLEMINTDTVVRGTHWPLVSNHNGIPKKLNLRIEDLYEKLDAYVVNGNEKRQIYMGKPVSQGITTIDDYLLSFEESSDLHEWYANLNILNKNTMATVTTATHNIGHVNSCDYDPASDRMVIGNNTALNAEQPPAIFIFNNARQLFTLTAQIDFNTADKVVINLYTGTAELGNYGVTARPNACFGESSDIIYLAMNDNKVIYRCFLGRGANNLTTIQGTYGVTTWGTFIAGKADTELNGTLRILGQYNVKNSFGVNQGIEYYNGKILLCSSSDKILTVGYELLSDGRIHHAVTYNNDLFDGLGNRLVYEPEGVCVDSGKLYQGFRGNGQMGFIVTTLDK